MAAGQVDRKQLQDEQRRLLAEIQSLLDEKAKREKEADDALESLRILAEQARDRQLESNQSRLKGIEDRVKEAREFIESKNRSDLVPYINGLHSDEYRYESASADDIHSLDEASQRSLHNVQGMVRQISFGAGSWILGAGIGAVLFFPIVAAFVLLPVFVNNFLLLLGSMVLGLLLSQFFTVTLRKRSSKPRRYTALLAKAAKDSREWRSNQDQAIRSKYSQAFDEGKERRRHKQVEIEESTLRRVTNELIPQLNAVNTSLAAVTPPWDALAVSWPSRNPNDLRVHRFGMLELSLDSVAVRTPTITTFPRTQSIIFNTTGDSKESAVDCLRSLVLRFLMTIPPGRLYLTLFDPLGLGQNVADFMDLAKHDEKLISNRAWTEPSHIEQRLADLTDHMETVIQKYLRNEFETIEEFNAKADEIAEPYRLLVVMDFPVNFSEDAARRLLSIAQNGPRCGVYVVALVDTSRQMPYGFNLSDLERGALVIEWDSYESHFRIKDEVYGRWTLELDQPPDAGFTQAIITAVGQGAKEASKVEVPFSRIAPSRSQYWMANSADGLEVKLGPSGAREEQELTLGQGTSQHVLVVGRTGSGKSTLLHTLVTNLALQYSPSEVQLYLIDFKKGVEFKTYASHRLPHARVIAIESEREFGLSVLEGLDAELTRRGDLFRAVAVDSLADYRKRLESSSQEMPRLLLIVDEFQEFFTEDDAIASQAAQILDRLVRQGRAFGIHVLLGSQTLAGSYSLARSTIDQMAVRIALMCSEADSRLILADDNPLARLLSRPGEAIYNDSNGRVEGNNQFQVAWLPDSERDNYLQEINRLAEANDLRPSAIIFEGNAPAELGENRALEAALHGSISAGQGAVAWLGEPIAIRDSLAAPFRRQSGSNLLIVGQHEQEAMGMTVSSVLSLAAQLPVSARASEQAAFYVLDFGAYDADTPQTLQPLADDLPSIVRFGRRRQLELFIGDLASLVQRRLDRLESGGAFGIDGEYSGPVYLVIYGFHRARDLRPDDSFGFSSFDEEPTQTSAQRFAMILEDGPEVGIHTIAWCNSVTNLNRVLDRRAFREFAMRVVMQMSAEDSASLIDSAAASRLGPHRALFYDEDEGVLEKFRPYTVPDEAWLCDAAIAISSRQPQPNAVPADDD